MQPLTSSAIHGTWGTVLLPINDDNSIDYVRLDEEIDQLLKSGLNGIYTGGTASEFYSLNEVEFDTVNQLVAERCEAAGVAFQLGIGHMSPQCMLERLERVRALMPGAIQVVLPDWVPTTLHEAEAFLNRLAQVAHPIGLILYNPPHAKHVLDPLELAEMRRMVSGLIGVKLVDGNASWYASVREALPKWSVFVPGHHLATGLLNGAQGSYSNVACLSPRGAKFWNDLVEQDPIAALRMEQKIGAFFQRHIVPLTREGYANPALDKLLCAAGDWAAIGTRMRWPYRSVSEDLAQEFASLGRIQLPEFFEHEHSLY